ncbi:MAG TPA: DUF3570 domain-containing protein [Polyangia bacterium]|nr:DUF3570 domain-containing protein [Polyangia bacterium]
MQLTPRTRARRLALAATVAAWAFAAAVPGTAAANTEAASRVTLFREPSTNNNGITVIHPQVDAAAGLGSSFHLVAGYQVDIVTGATPVTFGPRSGVDAVSGATHFSDVRHEVKGGFSFDRPSSGLGASYSYGWESDYKSHAISATTHSDLVDHNYTLAVGYTHNFDRVCDNNNEAAGGLIINLQPLSSSAHCFQTMPDVVTHHLSIDTFEPSLTWTATPRLVTQGGATIQILDGFQSNPYRRVLVGTQHRTPQEHMPNFRQRYAAFFRAAYALPDAHASLTGGVRFYRDSWAITAATAEANYNQYLGQSVLLTLRGRYHQQTEASFYRTSGEYQTRGPAGQFWTGDRELSPMSNYLGSLKTAYLKRPGQERSAWFSEIELSAKIEALFYRLDSSDAPNYDRSVAYIGQGSFALRF